MTETRLFRLLACGLLAALAVPAAARGRSEDNAARHGTVPEVRARRTGEALRIDGVLDEAVWQDAPAASDFRQRDPEEGRPASETTELRVVYDDDALYVGFRLFDREAARIVRRLSRRDEGADADEVRLYLDPHLDHRTGVEFRVTAAGVQCDSVIFNDSWDDNSWDAVWESAVSLDARGWAAELRIPFSQLRFPAADPQTWGINAARYIQRRNETSWLELVPKKESGLASRMAHLVGLAGLRPRRALSLLPYTVARSEFTALPAQGDPFNDGTRQFGGLGADLKYGITSNLTLDATVNPDFGQVEVDPAIVNLTEFETFFDEKRPFFLEGAQIFSNFGRNGANSFWGFNRSEPDLFYSRRIGRSPQGEAEGDFVDRPQATTILGAAKITGTTAGGWSVGVLEAATARERAHTAGGDGRRDLEVEPLTNYFMVRAHRDLARSGLGFLGTGVLRSDGTPELRGQLARRAYVAGVDGFRFLDPKKDWVVTGRLALSRLEGDAQALDGIQRLPQHYFQRPDSKQQRLDPGRRSLSGWTGALNLNRNSGNLQVNAALWATSPGFESNDLGFNGRSDRWGGHLVGTWRKTNPDRLTRRRSLSIAKWYALNFDGDRQGDGLHFFWDMQLRNYWAVGGNGYQRFRSQNDTFTRGGPSGENPARRGAGAWLETDSRRRASGSAEVFYSRNVYGSDEPEASLSLHLKPTSSFSLRIGPSYRRPHVVAQWVGSQEDSLAVHTYGQRYLFAEIRQTEVSLTTRLNWILSPRLSLQMYAQPLVSAGDFSEFKELAAPRQFRFTRYGADAGAIDFDGSTNEYRVDPDGSGPASTFTFDDPDFSLRSLRFNAVLRWEWRLGSTLYVVWTESRTSDTHPGEFQLGRDIRELLHAPGDDVFLVKFSYRFGR